MKNKIKLLILKYSMPIGGAETLIIQHLNNIDRTKFEIHLITQSSKGILLPIIKQKADKYMCLNRKLLLDPIALLKLRRYLINNSIDIVHSHDWISSLYLLLASKSLNIKKISTIHAHLKSWRNIVNSYVLKQYDLIICVSKYQRLRLFEEGIPWERMVVINNCIDQKFFNNIPKTKFPEEQRPFRIIMVGNFCWQKDHITLIKAFHIIKKHGFNTELHLVGGKDLKIIKLCKTYVKKKNLSNNVTFHGQKRVNGKLLSEFDLFAFSSKNECLPIAPLEAMACNLPVIVSDIPPNMEIIRFGKDGFYFETGNSNSCADKIIELITNPSMLEKMRENGSSRIKEFNSEIIVNKLENCYQSMLKQNNLQ